MSVTSESGPEAHEEKRTIAYRGLLAAVIILGALIVIALGTLVVGLVTRFSGHKPPSEAATPAEFTLVPGAKIVSSDISTDRLVLHIRGPSVDEIDIIDTQDGRLVAKIHASKTPPGP
ncbi:MAG TPA: hypothetical protein VGF97_08530 [Rhizomicrobium sp.]